jgi:hypothetical protein
MASDQVMKPHSSRRGNSRPGKRPARTRASWAVLLAVLLTFFWQSFVVQTHLHFEAGGYSLAAKSGEAGARAQPSGPQSPSDLPSNCPICSEAAHAGNYLLPAPITFVAPAPMAFWLAVTILLGLALVQRSHAWRSRAPPYQLQA